MKGQAIARGFLTVIALTTATGMVMAFWLWEGQIGSSPIRWAAVALLGCVAGLSLFGAAIPRHAGNIALLLVSIILPAIAIDQYLGRPSALNPRILVAEALDLPFDRRWPPDVALDEAMAGRNDTYPSITPPNFHHHPLPTPSGDVLPFSQVANARIVLCNEDGRYRFTATDRHGFVNQDSQWDRRDFSAVLVGDSFAEGWCVDPEESFASQLNTALGPVLNLGRGGMGQISEMAVLREYATDLTARNVIWTVFEGNDWDDLKSESGNPILSSYDDPHFSQHLKARRPELQAALKSHADAYLRSYAWKRLIPFGRWRATLGEAQMLNWLAPRRDVPSSGTITPHSALPPVSPQPESNGVDWTKIARAFALGFDQAQKMGARPIVVLLPSFETYPVASTDQAQRRLRLRQIVETLGGTFVDGDQAFRQAVADPQTLFPLKTWGHYTPEGHAIIADTIAAAISSGQP